MALDTIIDFLTRDIAYREAETRILREHLAVLVRHNGSVPQKVPKKKHPPKADKYAPPTSELKELKPDPLRDQILAAIEANPGWQGSEIAHSLGLQGKDVIRVYPRLEALRNRQVVRWEGNRPNVRYFPIETEKAEAA